MDLRLGSRLQTFRASQTALPSRFLVRLTAVLSCPALSLSGPASQPSVLPWPRPEKLWQSLMHPSHATSCFRRFWIFPRFSSLLCYTAQSVRTARPAKRPRSPSPPKGVNQRGRASAPGDQIPTDKPSWRARQFKPLFPVTTSILLLLRIDLAPGHPTCPHVSCCSHHHLTSHRLSCCLYSRGGRPASPSLFPRRGDTASGAAESEPPK